MAGKSAARSSSAHRTGSALSRSHPRRRQGMVTVLLLILSNILLNTAWYWHLLYPNVPLWQAIVVSWFIALFEYGVAVPANRIGYFQYQFTPAQLKIMQEVITLAVFAIFALVILQQPLRWNYFVSFGLLIGAVAVIFV